MKIYLDVENRVSGSGEVTPLATRRVWLVDDNRKIRESIREVVGQQRGLNFEAEFDSAETMLSHLAIAGPPDVILMDVQMEGMSGLEALRPVRELSPETPVVIMTAFFDAIWKKQALANGAGEFILKSAELAEFARVLREAKPGPVTVAAPLPVLREMRERTKPIDPELEGDSHIGWARMLLLRIRGMLWQRI